MTDLPSCPLCDASPEPRRPWLGSEGANARCGSVACILHLQLFRTDVWRALAAMRKPLTPDEADAMLRAHADAAEDLGALRRTCSQEDRHALVRRVDAAGDALRDALTGKR